MLTDTIGADATIALRRNAIHKLEQAAAEATAAGLTWREAKEILDAGYGHGPANSYAGASDLQAAASAVNGDLLQDVTSGRRGWLSWHLPYLTDPRWHAERPTPTTHALVLEVPESMAIVPGEYDPYWARPLVELALDEHPNAVRHGIDAPAPHPRDGVPLDDLLEMQEDRQVALHREWARANA